MRIAMTAWPERVYSDPFYLELYEHDDSAKAPAEAQAASRLLKASPGRWLDACCGFGRHAEQFALLGHDVVGVDASAMMLQRAAERAAGFDVRYVRADIRQLPFIEQFDYATLMFDSFGYFADDFGHLDALLSIGLALRPHGRLLIDVSNREKLLAGWKETESEQVAGCTVRKRRSFDYSHGRVRWSNHVDGHGRSFVWDFDMRVFSASELRDLLERAGFDEIGFYGDWDGSVYDARSSRMLTTARKAVFADIPALDI